MAVHPAPKLIDDTHIFDDFDGYLLSHSHCAGQSHRQSARTGFVQVVFFRQLALMLQGHARSEQIIDGIARHNVNEREDNNRNHQKYGYHQ